MAYHSTFEPLRITALLGSGVVADQFFPFDALIWYQAHRNQLGPEAATLPGGQTQAQKVSIPLKMINPETPNWYFAASWAQPQPWWAAEGTDYWNKRFDSGYADLVDFGKRRGKVIIEQGKYKAYHMPVFYKVADKITWYCTGDKAEIKALLTCMTHIGKKRSQGWGHVRRWLVESWKDDWSIWGDGRLMRGIPPEDIAKTLPVGASFEPFNVMNYGLRPSYYRRENQRLLAVAG